MLDRPDLLVNFDSLFFSLCVIFVIISHGGVLLFPFVEVQFRKKHFFGSELDVRSMVPIYYS